MKIDLSSVPNKPGCYLWKDKNDQILYVGKSKQLQKRMKQYFSSEQNFKTLLLIKNIVSFEYIVTRSDLESFLLEIKLIHKYEPKYNLKIKYSGFASYIVLSSGTEKILKLERRLKGNESYVFGPFPVEFSPNTLIKILREIFPFNKCKNPNSGIPCLYNQLNMCIGHCIKQITDEDYKPHIEQLKKFFSGETKNVEEILIKKITLYSEKLNFEEAQKLNKMLKIVKNFSQSQVKHFPQNSDYDFFAWFQKENYLSISISYIRFGKFIKTENFIHNLYFYDQEENSIEHLVENFISLFYLTNQKPKTLLIQEDLSNKKAFSIKTEIPQKGIKKDFIKLTNNDAQKRIEESFLKLNQKQKYYDDFLNFLKFKLNIDKSQTFELIDISSFGEGINVGAIVAFSNGEKDKKMYRKFILDEKFNNNDYGSLKEVIYRHFRNKLLNKLPFPDVLIIDGGKGQINSAKTILEEMNLNINLLALKKNKNHKTESVLFFNENKINEINLKDVNLQIKNIFSSMQEEVHRFVIEFNKSKRTEILFDNSLKKTTFLTKKNISDLYIQFETIHQMINANIVELEKIIGKTKSLKLITFFENLNK